MNLVILTPEKELFAGPIKSVKVPGTLGQFEILNNHAPIVAALGEGDVRVIKEDGESLNYSIDKGFIEVINNEASLLIQNLKKL